MHHDYFIRNLWIYAGLALAILIAYLPVRSYDFVNFDDPDYVSRNPHVRQGITPGGIEWAFTSTESANWFPLTRLSHMIDVEIFGLDAGWHHLITVLLHAIATLLLFAFHYRATSARWPSAMVALLFALHPLHVESVAWITERKDTLSALFWFLSLLAYVRYTKSQFRRRTRQSRDCVSGDTRPKTGGHPALRSRTAREARPRDPANAGSSRKAAIVIGAGAPPRRLNLR